MAEWNDELKCPCGSNKKYKNCCKRKGLNWYDNGGQISRSIPLKEEAAGLLEENKKLFEEMYDREPDEKIRVAWNAPVDEEELAVETIHIMRKAGIDERFVYATYKTGLIPSKFNKDIIPDGWLKEYKDSCKEFDRVMEENLGENRLNSLQYTMFSNDIIGAICEKNEGFLTNTMYDFLRRHTIKRNFQDYQINSCLDYASFSVYKMIKTLRSLRVLYHDHLTESIYALTRSLFENYLYVNKINQDCHFFEEKLLPRGLTERFQYHIKENGRIDYRTVIDNKTGKQHNVHQPIATLRNDLTYQSDKDLYDLFYTMTCRFVHVDILSAKSYFAKSDPYDEIEPSLIAWMISQTIMFILLDAITKMSCTKMDYTKDYQNLYRKMKGDLVMCFELAYSDPVHKNDLYKIFLERLNS